MRLVNWWNHVRIHTDVNYWAVRQYQERTLHPEYDLWNHPDMGNFYIMNQDMYYVIFHPSEPYHPYYHTADYPGAGANAASSDHASGDIDNWKFHFFSYKRLLQNYYSRASEIASASTTLWDINGWWIDPLDPIGSQNKPAYDEEFWYVYSIWGWRWRDYDPDDDIKGMNFTSYTRDSSQNDLHSKEYRMLQFSPDDMPFYICYEVEGPPTPLVDWLTTTPFECGVYDVAGYRRDFAGLCLWHADESEDVSYYYPWGTAVEYSTPWFEYSSWGADCLRIGYEPFLIE
jgi:hypothetical protein